METFLTVDSGGSKTKLVLYTGDGARIKDATTQGFGRIEDDETELVELSSALREFCEGYAPSNVVCNVGGKNKNQFTLTLKKVFPDAKIKVVREAEGAVGFTLCEKFGAQVTLMAGTGAIAVAPTENGVVIAGGWGANVSDKGSGYQLGLDAVRLALEELDGTEPCSLITRTLTGVVEPPKPMKAEAYCAFRDGVRKKLLPFDRSHIASFAKTVYACAEQGDEKALALYEKTGADLADIVLGAVKKAGTDLKSVVVTGGMVHAKAFWGRAFEDRIKAVYGLENTYYIADGVDVAMCEMKNKENIK